MGRREEDLGAFVNSYKVLVVAGELRLTMRLTANDKLTGACRGTLGMPTPEKDLRRAALLGVYGSACSKRRNLASAGNDIGANEDVIDGHL